MTSHDIKSLERRFVEEILNTGDVERADEFLAPDFVDHNPFPGTTQRGLEGFKQGLAGFRAAFPDVRFTIDEQISEGDRSVTRSTMTGTNTGSLMGMPPTGKAVTVAGMDITRWENGKIVEHWGQVDALGMMQQLGLAPTPESVPGS